MPLEAEFKKILNHQLNERGCSFVYDGQLEIDAFIKEGVIRYSDAGYAYSDTGHALEQSEIVRTALLLFADALIEAAAEQNTKLIDRIIIKRVKRQLCPLYPFCQ